MLPSSNRLTKKKDFQMVFKEGKAVKGDFLLFKTLKNNLKESRIGFVVSKKVSNSATVRNKVKRRLRNAVLPELSNITTQKDIVIVALPSIKNKQFLQIKEEIVNFFKKSK